MGQPLLGYPPNPGDDSYLSLGCGDVITGALETPVDYGICPVHGSQAVIHSDAPIMTDATSVARG
jgi:hypothetical protein